MQLVSAFRPLMPGTSTACRPISSSAAVCARCQRGVRGVSAGAGTLVGMTELAIEATGLTKSFGETKALAGVDLAAARGSVLAVLGANGAGKTTAVRIWATLLRAESGTARAIGFDVRRQPNEVRATIGLTGQFASVDEDLT